MFVRNFLTTGDHVMFVPVGMLITLQYDENGLLEKVFQGFEREVDVSDKLLVDFLENQKVPRKLAIKNGTTFIKGAICIHDNVVGSGKLPESCYDSILQSCIEDPDNYDVYVCDVESMAAKFQGGLMVSQWLIGAGFSVMPSMVIPTQFTEQDMIKMLVRQNPPFNYPMISGYLIHNATSSKYYSLDFSLVHVEDLSTYLEITGQMKAKISLDTAPGVIQTDYSDVIKNNIHRGDVLLLDEDDEILHCFTSSDTKVPEVVTCPVCGKKYRVTGDRTICEDTHCNSRLYPSVTQLLSTLHLPTISKDRYDEVVKNVGRIFSSVDILDEPEFEDAKVSATISTIMRAIIPNDVVSANESNIFTQFADRCNNVIKTVEYYLDHVDKINKDLHLQLPTKLFVWLNDNENKADLVSLFHIKQITVTNQSCKFEGDPIFRGKKIYITGDFIHGDSAEIKSILSSYSAEVTTSYSDDVDCVVIGDAQSNVNGKHVSNARKAHKGVFTESEFFSHYEIDKDLVENL